MYGDVLVPTDGSAGAAEALRHGLDLAEKYDATVHLVYVVDERVFGHYSTDDAIERVETALEATGEAALRSARNQSEAAGRSVETHLVHGIPDEAIVRSAREVGADLVVMGTERRSDEYRRLLGSVTERVVRRSPVPVHLVKAEAEPGAPPTVREANAADREEIAEVARRSMAASYQDYLAESDVDEAVEGWYGPAPFDELLADPDAILLVAVREEDVVGFSQNHLVRTPSATVGEIHWLHVRPDERGAGVGTALFARTREGLEDRGAGSIRGLVLADYEPGNAFYRTAGLERVGTRPVDVGGRTVEESVYAPPGEGGGLEPALEPRETEAGETLYVDYGEREIGSDGPFFAAYRSQDREQRYGWFCSNCEAFDTAMDPMGRIVCNECGNRHKATRWDAVATE